LRIFRLLLPLLLLIPFNVNAQQGAPAGYARQAFDTWLSAHNSGDPKKLEAFNAKYDPGNDYRWYVDFRESVGELKLLEVRGDRPNRHDALVLSEWGNTLLASIVFEDDADFGFDEMRFEGMPTPDAFKPAPVAWDLLTKEAARRLDELEGKDKLSGSFLMRCKGQQDFEWSGGLADREASTPVTPATRFRMASLGKMFTAVAILQLADAGRLSLDDPLSRHLPDYPTQAVARRITLRQLLNHTSGTGEIFSDEFPKISASLKTHRDYWGVFASKPLEFEPGTEERYSNYGYILLGAVVEAASGQDYYDYIDQHVFRPAGMTATGAEPEITPVSDRAHAYTKTDEKKWIREIARLPWRGTAAGGGYTTPRDLVRFVAALEDGTLVSAKSLAAATRGQNLKGWYGYGFMVSGEGRDRQYGHEGGAPGMNGILNARPAQGCMVAGLSNFDPASMANIVNYVTHRLP
jgi:CubicO group peptidase (beta-lactamase class C family)